MGKLNTILQERFRSKEKPKMSELAEKTTEGKLTVFSGLFGNATLGDQEKEGLSQLLQKYALDPSHDVSGDLKALLAITSEVKAINNQAAILHGERIKKAQEILKQYRDGAFTAWLISAYGNRQTPYNFLQYFEFCQQVPKTLRPQIDAMPRQAVYTLASREGPLAQKEEIVRNYRGETKQQMITLIRATFPLHENDRRQEDLAEGYVKQLQNMAKTFSKANIKVSGRQKKILLNLLETIQSYIQGK
jgi:Uncharacterised protein family (UPF0137)